MVAGYRCYRHIGIENMAILNLQNVTYKYPLTDAPALQNINLQVNEGEFLAVIGPNGAGKSTLCYTIAGFVPHFFKGEISGSVEVSGLESNSSSLDKWVLNVGLAFQNPFNQISGAKYTVFEEIAFGLENIGVPRDEMKVRVEDAMKLTGRPLALFPLWRTTTTRRSDLDPGHAAESPCPR